MAVVKAGEMAADAGHHHLLIDTGLPNLALPVFRYSEFQLYLHLPEFHYLVFQLHLLLSEFHYSEFQRLSG